jgi:hypothetical protein
VVQVEPPDDGVPADGQPAGADAGWLVVDALNVIGSRPTGWWRDRPAAIRAFAATLRRYAERTGTPITVVVDGRPLPDLSEGRHGPLEVSYARRSGTTPPTTASSSCWSNAASRRVWSPPTATCGSAWRRWAGARSALGRCCGRWTGSTRTGSSGSS